MTRDDRAPWGEIAGLGDIAGWDGPSEIDVCVAGAGIAGLTTAYLLLEEGKRVLVLDQEGPGAGETGRTSAHLADVIDDRFSRLAARFGVEGAKTLHESHRAAIGMIERIVEREGIDCEFRRIPGYLCVAESRERDLLDEEESAARRICAGSLERVAHPPGLPGLGASLRFEGQARFHPLKYLAGLVRAIVQRGGRCIFGPTARVVDMKGEGPVTVELAGGRVLGAHACVAATNVPSPMNHWAGIYTKQTAYRSYVVAVAVVAVGDVGDVGEAGDAAIEDCLYWDLEDPYHYVRRDGGLVLIGGEDHRAGMDGGVSAGERYGALEMWGARVLGVRGTRVKAWSGQVNEPADGVAFIGRVPGKGFESCYAITGDSGMGLTHGTLGAMLVTDLIRGRRSAWSEVYGPDRKPVHGLGEYAKENIVSAAQFKDYVLPGDVASAEEIAAGCGAVLREGLKLIAAYRDEEGRLVQRSAVCPHLKCVVRWNATAREWNCPCHGSRFDPWGRVLTGPAVRDLEDAGEATPEVRLEAP